MSVERFFRDTSNKLMSIAFGSKLNKNLGAVAEAHPWTLKVEREEMIMNIEFF